MNHSMLRAAGLLVLGLCVCVAGAEAADSCALGAAPGERTVGRSEATDVAAYRIDVARHIYAAYGPCVLRGKLPPQIHAVVLIELAVGRDGMVRHVHFIRVPAEMPESVDLVEHMIRRIAPFPTAAIAGAEEVAFNEVWMFDEDGRFQLGALTEGPTP